jgi:hypothetical protein
VAAAAAFDTPSLEFVDVGRTSVALHVNAGASGAPDGFTVEWTPASLFDASGGWDNVPVGSIQHASFWGIPTLNISDGTSTFQLAPAERAGIQIGDLFDETGVTLSGVLELPEGTEWVLRVRANGDGSGEASAPSQTIRFSTLNRTSQDCTFTLGYWKNHSNAWPVCCLTVGSVGYNQAQLLSILNEPSGGNGLVSLAHQLITAKLNLAQGAIPPAAVTAAINAADAMIGSLVVPPVGAGYLFPGDTSSLTQTLDDFNNGVTGSGHCGTVPVKRPTWGALKSSYR